MTSYIATSSGLHVRATAAVETEILEELEIPDPEDTSKANQQIEDARYESANSNGQREG